MPHHAPEILPTDVDVAIAKARSFEAERTDSVNPRARVYP